jgi:hypothetical protein
MRILASRLNRSHSAWDRNGVVADRTSMLRRNIESPQNHGENRDARMASAYSAMRRTLGDPLARNKTETVS